MDSERHSTIDPDRQARINAAVSTTEDAIAASRHVRAMTDQATAKLATAVRQATGVMGTDLLADRPGRLPKPKGTRS